MKKKVNGKFGYKKPLMEIETSGYITLGHTSSLLMTYNINACRILLAV